MCGIAGVIDLSGRPVDLALIRAMTDLIAHRGPDGEGQWAKGPVGLGHRRLAIIDMSEEASQPMISTDGRFILSYNGEVYNFRELRKELKESKIRFRTDSDTEVVLQALIHWGTEAISRLNGMFALALWDNETRHLLLARDRYGIKPLYLYKSGSLLAFASENKAFTAIPTFRPTLDPAGLKEYLAFQNFFTSRTLISDVELFPAGHFALVDGSKTSQIRFTKYWEFDFREPSDRLNPADYQDELNRLLQSAVRRQLVSDVEIGTYLSGGLDSAGITAHASTEFSALKSFTCGFDLSSASGLELAFDERKVSEALSARFETEHYEMVLKAGDMERCLPSLAWHLEEPRVGQSYPNFYAAKLASKFVKVVLAGTGGDELFGGYPWRYVRSSEITPGKTFEDVYFLRWQRLLNDFELKELLTPINHLVRDTSPRDIFKSALSVHPETVTQDEDLINCSLTFEAKTFLHSLLIVEDKLSMAYGLETRVPFLDNDLVDFTLRCPAGLKVDLSSQLPRVDENSPGLKAAYLPDERSRGKLILRDALQGVLPTEVVRGPKQGFSAPDASWFRGESINFVKEKFFDSEPRLSEIMDVKILRALVSEHLAGKRNRRLLVWSLLNLEFWITKNL